MFLFIYFICRQLPELFIEHVDARGTKPVAETDKQI
jgi:hypothetical protein